MMNGVIVMTICVGIIEDGLGFAGVYKNYRDKDNVFDLERCEIFCGGVVLQTGIVYLARAEQLPDTALIQEGSAMICIGMPPDYYVHQPLRLLVLEQSVELAVLVNEVNRIFFEYNTLEQRLQDSVNYGRSIQHMVDLIAPYFNGNEVQVGGADFRMLAVSNKTCHVCEISGIEQPDKDGMIAPEILTYFKNDIYFSQIRDLHEPFVYGPSILICRLICMNVFRRGEYVCRVMVGEDSVPFRGYETGLIRFFAAFIQLIYDLSNDTSDIIPRSLVADIFTDLLNGESVESYRLENSHIQRDWASPGPFLCATVMLSERDFYNRTIQYYCQLFNREYQGCCFFEFESAIVCVANLQYYGNSDEFFIKTYLEKFRDNYFRIGYSNCFSDILGLKSYYIQAKIAIRTGLNQNPMVWFHKFSDMVLHYMKERLTEELDGDYLCAPEVLTLREYDRENQSEYLQTLKVYFDNQMNAVKTAKDLFIHRATMEYRLNRIKELTSMDFKNPDQNFYINVSIRFLLKQLSAAGTPRE